MAVKNYQWRADLRFAGGDPGQLSHGVTPDAQTSWQTAQSGVTESGTYTYWYRDSNTSWQGQFQDLLSSRVALSVTQSWTTSVDNRNNLTVSITTTVNSIVRDDIRAPSGYSDSNLPGRNITLYKEEGGAVVWSTTDDQVATAHTLSGQISLGSETFTIPPGDMTIIKPSLYLHNQTVGSASYDDIWLGIQFRNPLPPNYVPDMVNDGNGHWLSHNRAGGTFRQYGGTSWGDNLKTIDGGSGTGDPPEIYNGSAWRNRRLIGQE